METRILGRTGLTVSRLGLGSGGPSRMGLAVGRTPTEAERLVGAALDLGVTFFDTAPGYGEAETVLGRALRSVPRDAYVLATKARPKLYWGPLAGWKLRRSVERSLRRMRVETLDLLQFHAVTPDEYRETVQRLLPEAERLRERGLLRHVGITEAYADDPGHRTLVQAARDRRFATVMVGYHVLDPGAGETVLPAARESGTGVLGMFVVRRALRDAASVRRVLDDRARRSAVPAELRESREPLADILGRPVASVPALAYRFVAGDPRVDVVLTGSSDPDHLRANARAVADPLPAAERDALLAAFQRLRGPVHL